MGPKTKLPHTETYALNRERFHRGMSLYDVQFVMGSEPTTGSGPRGEYFLARSKEYREILNSNSDIVILYHDEPEVGYAPFVWFKFVWELASGGRYRSVVDFGLGEATRGIIYDL
ncbi:hypothetical protein IWW38_002706 [Coemansia aciculifera]|uniref:Uncharacterized protein n=1 Tax=Coemansia aciculifera TaxID=417176 RepID=A0ACC1M3E1_9FUNG|nr:hypothetical protein IWW38_002706 [Coemansia aciculifera]